MVDTMNRAYHEEYPPSEGGCLFTAVIPTNIYGRHDNFSINGGHVIPGLVHKAYVSLRDGTPFNVWGSGSPLRQFIHALDLAELTVWVLEAYNDPSPVILSVDESAEVPIAEVARMVADGMGLPEGRLVFDTTKADGQYKKTASNVKLRQLRPDFKFRDMREGIKDVCQWFKDNYETARK
jgi:GDP-L-fucose synthase